MPPNLKSRRTPSKNPSGQVQPPAAIITVEMKTLHQSLIDYDMALLKAIAAGRGVPVNTPSRGEAIRLLAEALVSPTATAIALADSSEEEKEALQFLVDNGGRVEEPRFTRQYGVIRPMGPARLEREQPWQNPANPAEKLWYKGLIFKTFQLTAQGGLEVVYIPDDLLPLLRLPNQESQIPNPQSLQVSQLPAPALIVSGGDRLRENIFSLLVYLQTTPVRLQNESRLNAKDQKILVNCLLPPLLPGFTAEAELDFLLHLARRASLVVVKHGHLRPDRDPTRAWLQAGRTEQVQTLQNVWRGDPTWNDLWHVPGLVPRPTGWENSPLLARAKILSYLSQVDASPGAWYSIDSFIGAIKRIDPDFQRPGGDYESWYIQDAEGRSLMGFDNWDRVEGALIRYLLTHLLLLLGVVEVGLPAETGAPTGFRITAQGESFLTNQPVPPPSGQKPRYLRVNNNFQVQVSGQSGLYDRFQLARFAELERREKDEVIYRISRASVSRALRNGVTADQMVAFLARASNNRTPLKVVETLRTWGARQGTVQIERATLLRLKYENLVAELRQNSSLRPLLGEVIGPKTILVPPENVQEVRRLLAELGYLEH